jgi:hypothetical protein
MRRFRELKQQKMRAVLSGGLRSPINLLTGKMNQRPEVNDGALDAKSPHSLQMAQVKA